VCIPAESAASPRLFVDADACPVVPQCLRIAAEYAVPVLLVCDDAHQMQRPGAQTLTVLRGADSADLALVNRLQPGDVVVTQDYGLAALCLARRARVLHQDGHEYTADNIDGLLLRRHEGRKLRRAGGRTRGPARRTPAQDAAFEALLRQVLAACNPRSSVVK